MAELKDRILAEAENMNALMPLLPHSGRLGKLSLLELGGSASLVHNFYNGIENILKQVLSQKGVRIEQGGAWHKQLLESALKERIISRDLFVQLKPYLAFRHFFAHSYAFDIDIGKLQPLVKNMRPLWEAFQKKMVSRI